MPLPALRCYSCNDLIRYREFDELLKRGFSRKQAIESLKVKLLCCSRMYVATQEDLSSTLANTLSIGFSDEVNSLKLGVLVDREILL